MPALDATITPGQLGHISDHEAIAAQLNAAQLNALPVNAANYGAVGDGTTNDTAALQSALTGAAAAGAPLDLRGKTHLTNGSLTLVAGTHLTNGTIKCTGSTLKILNITGSNVRVERVKIIGRHATVTASAAEYGIYAAGASAASPITNLRIVGCSVTLVGQYGIGLKHVDGFRVSECDVSSIGYTGLDTLSTINGSIDNNQFHDNIAGFGSDSYGIALGRDEIDSLVTAPRSREIVVTGNVVSNIPWEGIDTHGGERITIANNVVTHCLVGIAVVGADGTGNIGMYAPLEVNVADNIIDSEVTDGSYAAGISFAGMPGAGVTDPALEYATGSITGNSIKGHGRQDDTTNGAIYARNTKGLAIVGNTFIEPSPFAIMLYYDNRNVAAVGNTVIDVWSTPITIPALLNAASTNNTGIVVGNAVARASKTATYVNTVGVRGVAAGTNLNVLGNDFTAVTTPISSTGATARVNADAEFLSQARFGGAGGAAAPPISFTADPNTGIYSTGDGQIAFSTNGALTARIITTGLLLADGMNISVGTGTGTLFGLGATQKIGFYGATPVVRPTATPAAATDPATTQTLVNDLRTKLLALGLIA